MADSKHTATVFLQVVPRVRGRGHGDRVTIVGLDVEAMTKKAPTKPRPGSVTVKLNVSLPDAVFQPLSPEVHVDIPGHGVEVAPVVEAEPVPVPLEDEEAGRG